VVVTRVTSDNFMYCKPIAKGILAMSVCI